MIYNTIYAIRTPLELNFLIDIKCNSLNSQLLSLKIQRNKQ